MEAIKWESVSMPRADSKGTIDQYYSKGDQYHACIFRSRDYDGWYAVLDLQSHPNMRIREHPDEVMSLSECKLWAEEAIRKYT